MSSMGSPLIDCQTNRESLDTDAPVGRRSAIPAKPASLTPSLCITTVIHMSSIPAVFEINPNSGVPIYRQIVDQVLAMSASGTLRPGDLLPSVRQVARDAAVNPMTVSKAYSRLEMEGIVRRVRGQGMEVLPPSQNGSLEERKEQFRSALEPALHRGRQLGLTRVQIREVMSSILQDQPNERLRTANLEAQEELRQ